MIIQQKRSFVNPFFKFLFKFCSGFKNFSTFIAFINISFHAVSCFNNTFKVPFPTAGAVTAIPCFFMFCCYDACNSGTAKTKNQRNDCCHGEKWYCRGERIKGGYASRSGIPPLSQPLHQNGTLVDNG